MLSPIQNVASKALKPARDLFSGIDDTLHARGELGGLRKQNDRLRAQLVAAQGAAVSGRQALKILHLDASYGLDRYQPVSATVIGQSPTLWYSTVLIDKGSSAGVHVDDPVVNGEGLVGKVTQVAPDAAQVTLLTDQTSAVAAKDSAIGARGMIEPKIGDPQTLVLDFLPANANIQVGDYVVTSGTTSSQDPSLFPPGLPIGQVSSVNDTNLTADVDVRPLANLRELDGVQVLTAGTAGAQAALAGLPPAGSVPTAPELPPTGQSASVP